jgi:hypothetical protein
MFDPLDTQRVLDIQLKYLELGGRHINVGYIYEKLVLSGLLDDIVTAPLKDSSLQRRVCRVLYMITPLREEDFPDNLKEHWRKLTAVEQHSIDPRYLSLTKIKGETAVLAMSLTRKEAKEVLRAYLKIVIGITQEIGATRKSAVRT